MVKVSRILLHDAITTATCRESSYGGGFQRMFLGIQALAPHFFLVQEICDTASVSGCSGEILPSSPEGGVSSRVVPYTRGLTARPDT